MSGFKLSLWIAGIAFMIAVIALAQWCDFPAMPYG
jgi:hypothetical protein